MRYYNFTVMYRYSITLLGEDIIIKMRGDTVTEYASKQVILEALHSSEQSPSDLSTVLEEQEWFRRPVRYKARLPSGVKTTTVQFLKERSIPGYQVHAITFEDVAGITWLLFCLVVQDNSGHWFIEGCSGIAGNTPMSRPFSPHPFVSLSGDIDDHFYAGGSIIDDTRLGIVRVRLLSGKQLIGEDTVQNGLVVFVNDQKIQLPLQFELYTQSGELVGSRLISLL